MKTYPAHTVRVLGIESEHYGTEATCLRCNPLPPHEELCPGCDRHTDPAPAPPAYVSDEEAKRIEGVLGGDDDEHSWLRAFIDTRKALLKGTEDLQCYAPEYCPANGACPACELQALAARIRKGE